MADSMHPPPNGREPTLAERVSELERKVGDQGEGLVKDGREQTGALARQRVELLEELERAAVWRAWATAVLNEVRTRSMIYGLVLLVNVALTATVFARGCS